MPTAAELLRDKQFYKLPPQEQLSKLREDAEFSALSSEDQKQLVTLAANHTLGASFKPPVDNRYEPMPVGNDEKPLVEHAKDFGRTLLNAGKGALTTAHQLMIGDPQGIRSIVQPQIDQFGKAYDSWKSGNRSEAVGHGLAGAIPFVGPVAADLGDAIGDKEYGKAAADALMLAGPVKRGLAESVPSGLRVIPRVRGAVSGAMEGMRSAPKGNTGTGVGSALGGTLGYIAGGPTGAAKGAAAGIVAGKYGPAMARGALQGWREGGISPMLKGLREVPKDAPNPNYPPPAVDTVSKIESGMPDYTPTDYPTDPIRYVDPKERRVEAPKSSEKLEYYKREELPEYTFLDFEDLPSKPQDPMKDFPIKYQKRPVTRKAKPATENIVRRTSDGLELERREPETPSNTSGEELAKIVDPEGKSRQAMLEDSNPVKVAEKRLLTANEFRQRANVSKLEQAFKKYGNTVSADDIDLVPEEIWKDLSRTLKIKEITPEMKKELKIRLKL